MEEIQKTMEYYQLLIDKFDKTGQSPNQLRVYKEVRQLVSECSSYDEIQSRMKSEGYYEKPAQALYMDKMSALKRAAEDNGFVELAKVYQDRYDEVSADAAKMFETGYEQRAGDFLKKHSKKFGAFYEIFLNYLYYKSTSIFNSTYKNSLNAIRENFSVLTEVGTSFEEVANDSYFREHINLDDANYMIFVAEAKSLISRTEPDASEVKRLQDMTMASWEILKNKRKETQDIGHAEDARAKKSVFLINPPEDASGSYDVLFNETEKY